MAGMGPPPNPQARRRNARPASVELPSEGRRGPVPSWPLPDTIKHTEILTALEQSLWADLWATPQSVAWERLGWTRDVAQYVRWKVQGELGDLDAAKEARQWSDRLGLSPLALLRLNWRIVEDEVADRRPAPQAASGPKRRLKVAGGAVAGA